MLNLEPHQALVWVHRILGLGLVLQTLELWSARRIYHEGVLAGSRVFEGLALRGTLAAVLCSGLLPALPGAAVLMQIALLANSVWLTGRSRGPVCGGSDSMFFQVQLGACVGSAGVWHPVWLKLGLGWIAVQCVLSYFIAGMAKARHAGWWTGKAMAKLLASEGPYVVFAPARAFGQRPAFCRVAGWMVVLVELGFPLVLFLPADVRLVFLGAGLVFHLLIALVLGLNRFTWAWSAAYPAVLAVGLYSAP